MSVAPPLDLDLSRAELARDLDGILAVDAATFERPWTRAMYEWEWTHSDVARFYVARSAGAVVAYCAGWVIFDELHINNLAVDPAPLVGEGAWEGSIAEAPRGSEGFGYDPIFLPAGESRTAAEMPAAERNPRSHRGQASRAFLDLLGTRG